METLQNQLTFLFADVTVHKYHTIADYNHLLAKGGLLSKTWNGLSLPHDIIVDTWSSDSFLLSPLQAAIYNTIYKAEQIPATIYDMVYCLGDTENTYDAFFQEIIYHCKYLCMDNDAFEYWKKIQPALLSYTAQWDFKGIQNYAFNTCNYMNVTIQNYLVSNHLDKILALLDVFSPLVYESAEYNSIGANISACTNNMPKASIYLKRALQLDPLNETLLQLKKKLFLD